MREPRERLVARGHARRHAVDVGVILDVIPQRRRREAEAARRRNVAPSAPYEIAEWIRVDRAVLGQPDAVADVAEASLDAKLLVGLDVDVGAPGELLVPVPRNDADVVVVRRGEIVARDVVAAVQVERVALVVAVVEDRPCAAVDRVAIEVERFELAGRRVLRPEQARAALGIRQPVRPWRVVKSQCGALFDPRLVMIWTTPLEASVP